MRFAIPLLASCAFALAGCGTAFTSGGGTTNFSAVVISGQGGSASDFFVTPGGTSPVELSANGQTSAGISASTVAGATFIWSASYLDKTSTYRVGGSPNGAKSCPPLPTTGTGAVVPLASGGLYQTADFTTPLSPTFATANIFVGAVPGVVPPYCMLVTASNARGSGAGSVVVVVSANP